MTFEILSNSSYVSLLPYIAYGGLEYQLSSVDAPNAGRSMDGMMHRAEVAKKDKWKIKCRPLTTAEAAIVLPLVSPQVITVKYLSPYTNSVVIKQMYVGNRTGAFGIERSGTLNNVATTVTFWKEVAFDLIEI